MREITGQEDPYKKVKQESNDIGLKLYPYLKSQIQQSTDPLLTALAIAGAGNIIDFGPKLSLDRNGSIENLLKESFAQAMQSPPNKEQYYAFREKLEASETVLYLGDNTGEIACDKLLVEEMLKLGKRIDFAVRGKPTINDATIEDANYVGLGRLSTIVSNGSDAPGTRLADCSGEFNDVFKSTDMIISKGQGNFEGLSGAPGPIFFLLKIKCPVIAQELNANIGDVVLRDSQMQRRR